MSLADIHIYCADSDVAIRKTECEKVVKLSKLPQVVFKRKGRGRLLLKSQLLSAAIMSHDLVRNEEKYMILTTDSSF
jgi:hypothetical protein